jgi:Na+(H+)/acetate symporter ActP
MMAFVGVPMWVAIIWRRANSHGAWAGIILGISSTLP